IIPTVVTNNGDGVNDGFEIPALSEAYPDSRIKVFDRWGKVIAEYKASDGGWDGTYNGKKVRSDDYWYEIYVPELYKYFTGHFTLTNK
ncbi:MAG: T9SS type B sorting domain-containing protein, partial [Paludibacteraceae bacterium]|nr:T9SS type B sorting domain-containing protein [Paludibacteraceae bacterium]MBR6041079.1 T9SS type B sorting domain-containing protein [Paludibacteraceae bacterium]MBR6042275.1 T9SS type B sorting domain-containing protein [Paludibacteraceae bacterium]